MANDTLLYDVCTGDWKGSQFIPVSRAGMGFRLDEAKETLDSMRRLFPNELWGIFPSLLHTRKTA